MVKHHFQKVDSEFYFWPEDFNDYDYVELQIHPNRMVLYHHREDDSRWDRPPKNWYYAYG